MAETITYEQLLALFKETDAKIKELAEENKKTQKLQQETQRLQQETQLAQQKTELLQQETKLGFLETQKKLDELAEERKKTDKQIKDIGKQIGDVNNKFGQFTEDILFNSLSLQMKKQFGTEYFDVHLDREIDGRGIEIDAVASSNGSRNEAYIIEVKSSFKKEVFEQLKKHLNQIGEFYPEFRNKKKYGVIAIPHLKKSQKEEILKNGFYPATMKGDILEIDYPNNFNAKEF